MILTLLIAGYITFVSTGLSDVDARYVSLLSQRRCSEATSSPSRIKGRCIPLHPWCVSFRLLGHSAHATDDLAPQGLSPWDRSRWLGLPTTPQPSQRF